MGVASVADACGIALVSTPDTPFTPPWAYFCTVYDSI